ncbi:hypothetical protein FA15DRAFT_232900 [Coprinopsis marcescibilis]|uniref:Uncharacterized protein n=1 Tax=Coprinopsis marcescibilis TaxID=230819 RepID=A0A5C3KFT0_COPMA|nr:hypothetical protein FA15DRAFT_232900 [Coprinopsis marcescibilis]
MASFQTYSSSNHFRHPWFDAGVMKRKQSPQLPSDMDDEDEQLTPPLKRRRCTTLENGIAHMSLSPSRSRVSNTTPSNVPTNDEISTPRSSLSGVVQQFIPDSSSTEEPTIPEVKMKTSSWYEPEPDRIVITDLDSFADEDDEADKLVDKGGSGGFEVHPAFLEHIRAGRKKLDPTSAPSQALVLFRPPPLPLPPSIPEERINSNQVAEEPVQQDEFAMDLDT